MIGHFDGDLLVYRAGFAAEKMLYVCIAEDSDYDDEVLYSCTTKRQMKSWIEKNIGDRPHRIESERHLEPLENALYSVKSLIRTALETLEIPQSDCRFYLSGPDNFRNGVATIKPYKGNRDETHKPQHGPAIKQFLVDRYGATYSQNEEADDVVAYSHYSMYVEDPFSSVIISVDKDLDMVPGLHYNFIKDESYFVSDEQAERYFHAQLLTGDSTDNIPGIPGIGPAKAARALEDVEDPWDVIKALYVQAYGEEWYEALTENGRLLWMRRQPEEWWNPPEHVLEDRIPY